MTRLGLKWIPIALFALLSLFLWKGLSLNPRELPSVQIGKKLPNFKLPRLDDMQKSFSKKQLAHRVALLNVWASWCEACIEEQMFLMQLSREGVALYGINYKDTNDDALTWLHQWGNPYQMIGVDKEGKTAIDLGVYGTPETYLIDKKGIIRYRHAGVLTQELWLSTIKPLMHELEQNS